AILMLEDDYIQTHLIENKETAIPILFRSVYLNLNTHWSSWVSSISQFALRFLQNLDSDIYDQALDEFKDVLASERDMIEQRDIAWTTVRDSVSEGVSSGTTSLALIQNIVKAANRTVIPDPHRQVIDAGLADAQLCPQEELDFNKLRDAICSESEDSQCSTSEDSSMTETESESEAQSVDFQAITAGMHRLSITAPGEGSDAEEAEVEAAEDQMAEEKREFASPRLNRVMSLAMINSTDDVTSVASPPRNDHVRRRSVLPSRGGSDAMKKARAEFMSPTVVL
ncbi:protein phosphatase 2A, regulatory B subunit, B56, partial [Kipferlia bialata]